MADIGFSLSNDPKTNPLLRQPQLPWSGPDINSKKLEKVAQDASDVNDAASLTYKITENAYESVYRPNVWLGTKDFSKARDAARFISKAAKPVAYLNVLANTLEFGTGLYSDLERNDGKFIETSEAAFSLLGNVGFTTLALVAIGSVSAPALIAAAAAGYLGQYAGGRVGRTVGEYLPPLW